MHFIFSSTYKAKIKVIKWSFKCRNIIIIIIRHSSFLPFLHTATLLVAINEIKKSAHKQGVTFYEYGTTHTNTIKLKVLDICFKFVLF